MTTWRELWDDATRQVGDRIHARWLCEVASGCDPAEFLAELDQQATNRMVAHLDAMILRRQAGEPIQYVLGRWQFRHVDVMIDRRVLIPRPETEWVVEAALGAARRLLDDRPRPLLAADLGTGSGVIGLSLAAELPIGAVEVWLTDASADALDVARANAAGLGRAAAAVHVGLGSWFDALPGELAGRLDLIVANPPYVATGDRDVTPDVVAWEPHQALFAGDDGLRDVHAIAAGAPAWMAPGGYLVLEIGRDQGAAVRALLAGAGLAEVAIKPDLAGHDRIAIARQP